MKDNHVELNKALAFEKDENLKTKEELAIKHLEAVLRENQKLNLTRINTIESGRILHIEDSLSALDLIIAEPDGLMADIGSGAGYPGIPLAIFSSKKTILVESVKKKAMFLKSVITELGLSEQVSVIDKRAEEIAGEGELSFSIITSRAVAELPVILELAAPLLAINGILIAYKGQPDEEEIERGNEAASILGMKQEREIRFTLSDEESKRTIIMYRKFAQPSVKLPRRPGMAQKRPLK